LIFSSIFFTKFSLLTEFGRKHLIITTCIEKQCTWPLNTDGTVKIKKNAYVPKCVTVATWLHKLQNCVACNVSNHL